MYGRRIFTLFFRIILIAVIAVFLADKIIEKSNKAMDSSIFEEFSELESDLELSNQEIKDYEMPTIKGKLKEKAGQFYESFMQKFSRNYLALKREYLPKIKQFLERF